MLSPTSDVVEFGPFATTYARYENTNSIYQVYFIPGNPGLISYYNSFLAALCNELATALEIAHSRNKQKVSPFKVYGRSLGGFEVKNNATKTPKRPPLGLRDQIIYVEQAIFGAVREHASSNQNFKGGSGKKQSHEVKLILIGHSVGAYILMEILRRWNDGKSEILKSTGAVSILGGICLFPTVVDIAKSDSGRKLGLIAKLPETIAGLFGLLIAMFARLLSICLPTSILVNLVRLITGFPEDSARVTAEFLCSVNGVRQALHMGRDEMIQINEDQWDDRIWNPHIDNAIRSPQKISNENLPPKLFFYFGLRDHWVNDRTRDHLISTRGNDGTKKDERKPTMEIDKLGVPHGFCIRHSNLIATKVAKYIEHIMDPDARSPEYEEMTSEQLQNYPMLGF